MALSTDDLDRQIDFLSRLGNPYLACRQGHNVPPLAFERNGKLPKGVRAVGPYPDGTFDVIRACSRCGLELATYTDGDGMLLTASPRRRYPNGYLASGMGRVSRRLATTMGFERVKEALFANAQRPPAA